MIPIGQVGMGVTSVTGCAERRLVIAAINDIPMTSTAGADRSPPTAPRRLHLPNQQPFRLGELERIQVNTG